MAMTLQHPYDKHPLIRKELSDRCSLKCSLCAIEVCGTAYCCEEEGCYFILDESCASVEFPQQITEHPIHPDHPLVLQNNEYYCHLCDIGLEASEVIATLTPLEEKNTIHHVGHGDHYLTAFHVKVPNWIKCSGCLLRISDPAYGCHSCRFFLHESCALLPREILQHPFHPEHPLTLLYGIDYFGCDIYPTKYGSELSYHCHECEFRLDVPCAVLPMVLQYQLKQDSIRLDHFSHKHQLLSGYIEEEKEVSLSCAVCELEILGEVYYCLDCIFFLHKLCAEELPKEIVHYLHPEHPLILLPKPPHRKGSFKCGCCQNDYTGMVFHCVSCDFDLDPKCALQTSSAIQDGVASTIQHFGHDHPLTLLYLKITFQAIMCKACDAPTTGLAYGCNRCSYFLHKSCAELPLLLENPLHPPHSLNLLLKIPTKPFNCKNCRLKSNGFSFCCSECDFYLCRKCATKIRTLKHQLHEHTLLYFDYYEKKKSAWCNSCGKPCHIDLYRCRPCNFNLHSSCLPLQSTVQHECHPYHPLVLFDRFVDGRHDDDDQYCDYCEEIRNPDHGVYRCAQCSYTVHIGCVLPQVTLPVDPNNEKRKEDILSLEETIKAKEKELEALKEKLRSLWL